MDNDTLRRGRPTLHVVYGDGIAILAGDGLQAEAFALLAREPATDDPVDRRAQAARRCGVIAEAAGAAGMVGGQAIDLQAAGQAPGHALTLDADGLRAMHARKTGALIRAVGGERRHHGAAATTTLIDAVRRVGRRDRPRVSDRRRHPRRRRRRRRQLGKTAGKDAAGDKPTYPALFGLERSRAHGRRVRRARGASASARATPGSTRRMARRRSRDVDVELQRCAGR